MKVLTLFLLISSILYSKVYYSKVSPYEIRNISANVSGLITYTNENLIGKYLSNKPYILIDAEIDNKELKDVKNKLLMLHNTVNLNKEIVLNLNKALVKKRKNYTQIKLLKIKSRIEKDKEFYDLINSENNYLSTKKEINNLLMQIADLELRFAQLQKNISDKTLKNRGFVLYSIEVKVGQVVNLATPLAKIADTSRAILTIYLDDKDISNVQNKTIYINNKKTNYKIDRLLKIADTTNISKYKAQIIIKAPKLFSKLTTIEFKNK